MSLEGFLPGMKKLLIIFVTILVVTSFPITVYAESLDEQLTQLENQIKDLQHQKELSENATKPLEGELQSINTQINQMLGKIASLDSQIAKKEQELALLEKNIKNREEELIVEQDRFAQQVKNLYIRDRSQLPITIIASSGNATDLSFGLTIEASVTKRNISQIEEISGKIKKLQEDKDIAQKTRAQLADAKTRVQQAKVTIEDRGNFLKKEIDTAKKFQENLSGQIAALSAKQQSILAAKNGSFTTGVGDVPLPDDETSSPTYNPGFSPAFAGFSFGAYTHRKGMSQYGAKGRAEGGQNYKDILKAYYQKDVSNKDTGGTIKVEGQGDIDFEGKYLMGIAEMPSSFPMEALKAQAVAARSYAYRYKKDGNTICTTESCQVYSSSKAASPPDAWKQAVEQTKGQILEDVVTYYSSTTGGYVNPLGWDTTDGNGGPGFAGRAWESKAKSPWFYKAWYKSGYSSSSDRCGRSSPWLNQEEMADILNAYLVQNKGGVDTGKITPVTTSCWGGNPYSMGELRDLANNVGGGAVTSVNSVSVSYGNNGTTASISFGTNRGTISIDGSDFKQVFNLRAPGYTSIKSPLFNIEKK